MAPAWGHTAFARQWRQAILGKMTKKRNRSNPTRMRNRPSRRKEKFIKSAGIMAVIGANRATIYRWLLQNRPCPRFGKSLGSPGLAILFEIRFKPEMQRES
jgi:hypothetical protein